MKRLMMVMVVLLQVGLPIPGGSQSDQLTNAGLLSNREGLKFARSAVVPFQTQARSLDGPQPGFVTVSQGRGGSALPDFSSYQDIQTKKLRFFSWLIPLVDDENERLSDLRKRLDYIYDHQRWGHDLDHEDQEWLAHVSQEFGLDGMDVETPEFWTAVRQRVDALPEELVLVQAANESAWGTSRFAREGNNLFGQWCFRQGCGLVPINRPEGMTYEVARFDTVDQSVASYMHNLNTGHVYQELREIRADHRQNGEDPDASELAGGLMRYSERGQEYIDELRAMIRHNTEVIEEARERLESNS
jgi:Bax protein